MKRPVFLISIISIV